jgi:putative addiction module component (TIGR02574 family)
MSAAELLEQFRRLPIEEQLELVEQMNVGLEQELTPEQIAKLEARAERLRRHPEEGIPWETVRAKLESRLEKSRAFREK